MQKKLFWKEQLFDEYCLQYNIIENKTKNYNKIFNAFMCGISVMEEKNMQKNIFDNFISLKNLESLQTLIQEYKTYNKNKDNDVLIYIEDLLNFIEYIKNNKIGEMK